jgi:phthalate 4,5-cis-dihydrodiol dehydrogenase
VNGAVTSQPLQVIGVGIVGAGWWAREHARAVMSVPTARLIAFASRSPERIAGFERDYGVPGLDDYRRLLERADVDAVVVAVPHDLHATIAIAALDAGKHVLLEKPMARDWAECTAIADAVRRGQTAFMLGMTHHFNPAVAAAHRIVAGGDLGPIVAGSCLFTQTWNWRSRAPFYRERALGGGVWLTLGIHFVDRLLWLLGTDVIAVKAILGRRFHTPTEHAADDIATTFLHFAGDVAGTIMLAGFRAGPPRNEMHIVGEHATLRLDERELAISQGESWQPVPVEEGDPMEREWAAWCRSITEGAPSPVGLEYALALMEVVFAAEGSSATGLEIRL